MRIYAISDIHGCLREFEEALSRIDLSGEVKLILLGDYIHGADSYDVLDRIMQLQQEYGEKVVVLKGNHEQMAIDGRWDISESRYPSEQELRQRHARRIMDTPYLRWMKELPLYYTTEHQIFCHAGIDEEAGDLWNWGTPDYYYMEKYPPQTGHFYMDIIAGHVGSASISGNPAYNDIYYDGASHYYIDGSTRKSGVLPVLMVDTDTGKYYKVTETGLWPVLPYEDENS